MSKPTDLLQGTLDLLILTALTPGRMHGWSIAQQIKARSNDVLQVQQGSLYPALHKLETNGLIAAEWGESENNRRAKYYRLTASGKAMLRSETEKWNRISEIIGGILAAAPEEV